MMHIVDFTVIRPKGNMGIAFDGRGAPVTR